MGDWLSVGIGLFIFMLAHGVLSGTDLLGWAVATSIWTEPSRALGTLSPVFAPSPVLKQCIELVNTQVILEMTAFIGAPVSLGVPCSYGLITGLAQMGVPAAVLVVRCNATRRGFRRR